MMCQENHVLLFLCFTSDPDDITRIKKMTTLSFQSLKSKISMSLFLLFTFFLLDLHGCSKVTQCGCPRQYFVVSAQALGPRSVAVIGGSSCWWGCSTGCSTVVVRRAWKRRDSMKRTHGGKVQSHSAQGSFLWVLCHGNEGGVISTKSRPALLQLLCTAVGWRAPGLCHLHHKIFNTF